MKDSIEIYTVRDDVRCLKCGCKGAVNILGDYYPVGLGDKVDEFGPAVSKTYEKYRNQPYLDRAMGFGGTIPHRCLNCGNSGLIDIGGLEGYKKAFQTIKEVKNV